MRLKIWWVMAAVAVAALGLGGERCRRHYRFCKQAAVYHAKQASLYARQAAVIERGAEDINRAWEENFSRRRQPAGLIAKLLSRPSSLVRTQRESVGGLNALRDRLRRWSEYESHLGEKYDKAARHPWRAIPPDPPSPQ